MQGVHESEGQKIQNDDRQRPGKEGAQVGEKEGALSNKKAAAIVQIDEQGQFIFTNQQELANSAKLAMTIATTPDHLKKAGIEAVMAALVFVKQKRLHQSSMNYCAFIKGKLTQYGRLVTGLAERHIDYGERRDFFVDENGEEISSKNKNLKTPAYAAIVQIKKKNGTVWNEYFFTMDDAKRAGLIPDNISKDAGWYKYAKDMLFHKANSRALNANYASALEGINYHEDLLEVWDPKDVTPITTSDKANILNNTFAATETEIVQ